MSAIFFSFRCLLLVLLVMLVGCSTLTETPSRQEDGNYNPNAGRYSLEHDVPVLEDFDLSAVKPVVPVAEARTRAGNRSPYTINGQTYHVMHSEVGYSATGNASWYGRKFHGHSTANGEVYDMFQLSGAHRTLPIPSFARVTNLDNGRQVMVRINDRGPFHDERLIDLSYAAASILGFAENGTARVRVEAVAPDPSAPAMVAAVPGRQASVPPLQSPPAVQLPATEGDDDYLQVGAFSSADVAKATVQRLAGLTSLPAFIRSDAVNDGSQVIHRVRIGPLSDGVDLDTLTQRIINAGLGTPFRVRQ